MFSFPVQFIRTDGFEFIEFRVENFEVEVMTEVDPGSDKECEVRSYKRVI